MIITLTVMPVEVPMAVSVLLITACTFKKLYSSNGSCFLFE